jgi:hypothetical protein
MCLHAMRFEKKDIALLIPATLLAVAGLGPDDPWVVGPCLFISWLTFIFICVIHEGSRRTRAIVGVVITIALFGVGYRRFNSIAKYEAEQSTKSTVTAATATEQDGFFDATSGKAMLTLGGTFNVARDFSTFDNGYAEPLTFWNFSPVRFHLKDGALYCDVRIWQSKEHQGVEITDGKYRVWPSQWALESEQE